ncbi:MAG: mechanosensitive ion channel [Acholeplasmatales bacterium]|nr:mechanosensitive ion channel [Acholeplasmatales bacterium]
MLDITTILNAEETDTSTASNIKDAKVDWNDVLHVIAEWCTTTGIKILISIIVMVILFKIINVFSKRITKRLERKKADATLSKVLVGFIRVCLKILVIIGIIGYLGFETASLTAVVGSTGVGISLAVQGTLSNFAAGVIIVVMRPFKLGDFIESNSYMGTVDDIKLFYTTIIAPDNKVVRIPNAQLANNVIVNVNEKPVRRLEINMTVAYDTNLKRAKEILKNICNNYNLVLQNPEPFVEVSNFLDSAVEIRVRVWVKSEDYWNANWYLLDEFKNAFDENHITIPFNQLDVNINKD